MTRDAFVGVAFLAVGCASGAPPSKSPRAAVPALASKSASLPAVATPDSRASLPFIENDYARALAEARAKRRPIFVDAWAPWCHTCMSLRAYVFTDPAMMARRDDFIWLSVDTERAENADFLKRFAVDVLPTLWVIDPVDEAPVLKWLGSLTAPELARWLDGASSVARAGGGVASDAHAVQALARGNHASALGHAQEAIVAYRDALKSAPRGWPERASVVDMLVSRLEEAKELAACAETASAEGPGLPLGTSRVNVVVNGASCALDLPKNAPARAGLPLLMAELKKLAADPSLQVLADDRSGIFEELVYAFKSEGNAPEARKVASAWATFLEGEAARASTPSARAVFDPHRLAAYIELGEAARALPMLLDSERDFPNDYNPSARLARAYLELKRYDEASAAAARASAKAYGPRRLRICLLAADIFAAQGDRMREEGILREGLEYARTIPLGEAQLKLVAEVQHRFDAVSGSAARRGH